MTESSKDAMLRERCEELRREREILVIEIGSLRVQRGNLEVDIIEIEQQKRTLTVTIEQMSYNKRSWWQRLLRI